MSGIVRAKFFCNKAESPEGSPTATVALGAVCRGVENAIWSQATPSGSIQMTVLNTPAFEQFEYGAEYEVTFRKVPKPLPNDGHTVVPAANMHGTLVCEFCGMTLGYTEEAVERAPYYAQFNTEEKRAEYLRHHEEAYGAKKEDA